jgi:aminopeptidase YwaD
LLDAFDTQRVEQELATLCAAPFAGRRTGTAGHERAQAWLIQRFQEHGLSSALFEFTLDTPVLDFSVLPTLTLLGEDHTPLSPLTHRTEFCEHPRSAYQAEEVEGVVRHLDEQTDFQGAWIMLEAVPRGQAFLTASQQWRAQGAVGILTPQYPGAEGYLVKRIVAASPVTLPVLAVQADLLPQLHGKRIRGSCPLRRLDAQGGHVLGQIPGSEQELHQAPLLVGAHYDGIGDDAGGHRFPCATDNAAAVAIILELAGLCAAHPVGPRRPIIFAAFDAEEVNASGSAAYAHFLLAQGVRPLVLNLDGAARMREAVWVEPGTGADPLITALDQAGRWLDIPLVVGAVSSDNRRFAQVGIPAAGIAAGGASFHTPADTVERVEPEVMRQVGRLLLMTIWQLAWNTRPAAATAII